MKVNDKEINTEEVNVKVEKPKAKAKKQEVEKEAKQEVEKEVEKENKKPDIKTEPQSDYSEELFRIYPNHDELWVNRFGGVFSYKVEGAKHYKRK